MYTLPVETRVMFVSGNVLNFLQLAGTNLKACKFNSFTNVLQL